MKNALILGTFCLLIAGCGGGNGGGGNSAPLLPSPSPPPVAEKLGAYIGTWEGSCQGGFRETFTISRTPGTTDSISGALQRDWFAGIDCTGTVTGTSTQSSAVTAKYVTTASSPVVIAAGNAAVAANVDQVVGSQPQYTESFTGPGVIHTVTNGQPQWCISFGGGGSTCYLDGPHPEVSNQSGGLLLQGSEMFILVPGNGIYTVDVKYTKK